MKELKEVDWHGEHGYVIHEDVILVGNYSENELEYIVTGFNADDPDVMSRYADRIVYCDTDELEQE